MSDENVQSIDMNQLVDILAEKVEERLAEKMQDREKEMQASVWSLLFLVSEGALAFRNLRDLLHHRGALQQEDEKVLNELSTKAEALKAAYQHTESAFREKFERVRFAMDNPNQVNQQVEQQEAQSALDKALNIDRENNAPPASEQTGGGENNSISGEFLTL